ncbi:MAG: UDP-N-acetylmuramoyl-tripeptide--D-alanyl-D-alanine ligase [Deltaproteobacteria bacterium]|jgi:UDP-N-acetylmuramoyl-tripeptide--D-alanyl-D-alanine ligase|nr:UDP-N-acetylmuramoyl-tripeptide--D-alanyl-D-alanine ligase [Deltaproteobacteria bacterium]MBT6433556.1 UDP-N-acetylmuramoyl-tripeptide--D-alanyl-D-alanine ligase [Deltaproteobacteria bacterium]MBT6490079.1 UDP-N-acetylmuramoyl-tripeptide--D-alanyl-D-alanine ligase [Deltaproteobacteria bacterium]
MQETIETNQWLLDELARATQAELRGGGLPAHIESVGTDTRSLPPRSLFVALRGENFDGHEFLQKALDSNCLALMVDKQGADAVHSLEGSPVPALVVDDTLFGYGELAAFHRRQMARPVAAVTGSNGKTTTKELMAAALNSRGPVHKTAGNFNNLIGVPKTILDWKNDAWAAVVEMGMNIPGEIERLTQIAAPDVAVITNVAGAHLEGLGSIEGVARAKGELFANLPPNAVGVVNLDDPMICSVCLPLLGTRPRLTFGKGRSADVRILEYISTKTGCIVRLSIQGHGFDFPVPLFGVHQASNIAAAVSVALALGSRPASIQAGLSGVAVPGGRCRVFMQSGRNMIDDSYNANPASMSAAFKTMEVLAGSNRRLAALGSMFELGDEAAVLHFQVGENAAKSGIDEVFALGPWAKDLAAGAQEAGARGYAFEEMNDLTGHLTQSLKDGEWLLVKGSRGMRMERVFDALDTEMTN